MAGAYAQWLLGYSHPRIGWLLKEDGGKKIIRLGYSHPRIGWLLKDQEPELCDAERDTATLESGGY